MSELDLDTPGGVYLCQVSDTVSCGACCGLYNVMDATRETLTRNLARRTEDFRAVERKPEAIMAFAREVAEMENPEIPYPKEFHHCAFVGFMGDENSGIGCLLHPLAGGNNGVDFRGLSYYGGFACRTYFCGTCRSLDAGYKRIVRAAAPDWHIYGLVMTETAMLDNFFKAVAERHGSGLPEAGILDNPRALAAVGEFLELKRSWPFRPEGFKRFGNYFFEEGHYRTVPVDFAALGRTGSVYAPILEALASVFKTPEELSEGEKIISDLVETVCSRL